MKLSITAIVVIVLLQIFLAVSPLIPWTSSIWKVDSPQAFYSLFATVVGIQFTLITAAISLTLIIESGRFDRKFTQLVERVGGAVVRRLRDDAFHSEFLAAVRSARAAVRISYFAPFPPSSLENPDLNRYYDDIAGLMRRRTDVRFKRIVRDSSENRQWIGQLVREFEGCSNVDIAVLRGDRPARSEMPLSLSIQIIDENKVWFVAIESHEREGAYRDLYIESPEAAQGLTAYYTRLWDASQEILSAGRVTELGIKFLDPSET